MTVRPNPDFSEILSQLIGDEHEDNRKLAAILTALNSNDPARESEQREKKALLQRFKSLLRELRTENHRLREVNEGLLAHSELLAAAVGACPECWGEDPACSFCDGDGAPGAFMPERDSFDEFVKPALTMVRHNMIRRRREVRRETAGDVSTQRQDEKEPPR